MRGAIDRLKHRPDPALQLGRAHLNNSSSSATVMAASLKTERLTPDDPAPPNTIAANASGPHKNAHHMQPMSLTSTITHRKARICFGTVSTTILLASARPLKNSHDAQNPSLARNHFQTDRINPVAPALDRTKHLCRQLRHPSRHNDIPD